MVKIQVNSQGKAYIANGKALIATEGGIIPSGTLNVTQNGIYDVTNYASANVNVSGGSGTTDVPLTRFKDDNNNEIGTHYMNFEDANGNVFKVILLDAQYRLASSQWASNTGSVTNLPLYNDLKNSNVWEAGETATFNTQKILDWCATNTYTSTACSHCRSKSFIIDGTTYYGQLPNMIEVIHLAKHYNRFDVMDTSASSQSSLNFSSSHYIWSSNQCYSYSAWYLYVNGYVSSNNEGNLYFACPVLEIPA